MAWAPMSTAWTPMRPGTSVSLGSDIGATACHRCHCSVTSVPGSLGLCSASCWLCDLSDAAFMTSPKVKIALKVPSPGRLVCMDPKRRGLNHEPSSYGGDSIVFDPTSSGYTDGSTLLFARVDEPTSLPNRGEEPMSSSHIGMPTSSSRSDDAEDPMSKANDAEDPMSKADDDEDPMSKAHNAEDPTSMTDDTEEPRSKADDVEDFRGNAVHTDTPSNEVVSTTMTIDEEDPTTLTRRAENLRSSLRFPEDPVNVRAEGRVFVDSLFVDDESPNLAPGDAFTSSSSCSSDSGVSSDEDDDEDTFIEAERTKKAKKVKKKAKVKARPDPPGSSLSKEKSLRLLRKKCGISEEIVLVAPTPADRADAPPSGYMTLFENYIDQCLLWFPLPCFFMRFLVVHGVCLAQINPRGIRHLLGIYVLSRECDVVISTEHLSYLTDFRVRGRSEELKHSISERTVEADCIDLVKPSLPEDSEEFLTAMHKELSSGNGYWRKSFSRKRIERALSAEIFPGKILGRGLARRSFREQAALEVAAKAKRSSGSSALRVVAPMASSPTASLALAKPSRPSASKTLLPPPSSGEVAEFRRLSPERARISNGKGKGVNRETPSKRKKVDSFPAAVVGRETSVNRVGGLLRDEAYSVVKSKASEFSLSFDRLVRDYDEDVRARDSELSAAKEANATLQSRLDELAERNKALERDALSVQKVKKDCEDKLKKLKSRCTKAEGEAVQLRGELSSASDLQRSRIENAVAEVKDEMARSFWERTSEVAGLLAEIDGKAQNDMLNLTEIDANLEFIGLLQGSEPPDLSMEAKALHGWRHPIYDAHDVFADLLASVRRVLEIPGVPTGTAEAGVAVAADDDEEVSDEDDVEAIDDDGVAED
ncbi:hypothetical protein AALP_AAs60122U000100 [Arabis alpina]|uniref:Uncharacterized protein n=1 Tax=Arabis alpina TaxID=50452 RepID=A0A087FXQ8_ARAAL|nr:hypothetical protein AALP_AAs60122U000100 [Arabis alpina]